MDERAEAVEGWKASAGEARARTSDVMQEFMFNICFVLFWVEVVLFDQLWRLDSRLWWIENNRNSISPSVDLMGWFDGA